MTILTDPSVANTISVSQQVADARNLLRAARDEAIPDIDQALRVCADGDGPAMWWYGASELCRLLAEAGTPAAKQELLQIVRTDSDIVEFDQVRSEAVLQIAALGDPALIPELEAAVSLPHAPVREIAAAVLKLGGKKTATPETVILEAKAIPNGLKAIENFIRQSPHVAGWQSAELRAGFYWWFGLRVERMLDLGWALPCYAAAVAADPDSGTAAWEKFPQESPSARTASELAKRHPLDLARLSAEVRERRRFRNSGLFAYLIIVGMVGGIGCGALCTIVALVFLTAPSEFKPDLYSASVCAAILLPIGITCLRYFRRRRKAAITLKTQGIHRDDNWTR